MKRIKVNIAPHPKKLNRFIVMNRDTKEIYLKSSRDPEHEVCRYLKDIGVEGEVDISFCHTPSFILDINHHSKYTIQDSDAGGLRKRKWKSFEM